VISFARVAVLIQVGAIKLCQTKVVRRK
jgi:hypothetical protein